MQDGSWNQPLPVSLLLKDPAGGDVAAAKEGNGAMFTDGADLRAELEASDSDFADLNAFLNAEEINRSLDLAWEAFGDMPDDQHPPICQEQDLQQTSSDNLESLTSAQQSNLPCADDIAAVNQNKPPGESPPSPEKVTCHKPAWPVYKQDKPRLVHEGLELNDRTSSATEFCSRAATFIEELSSIFKGSVHVEQESASPDSGYVFLGSQRPAAPAASSSPGRPEQIKHHQADADAPREGSQAAAPASQENQHTGVLSTPEPLSPPCFIQKLKSQEVAEGSPIRLECRVSGNPLPLIRWFCEGRELHDSPDIQIWRDDDLHTLVIAEAFEDDTGRYTCVASNSLGADNTSAEVYIEGASSSDSDGERASSKSRSGSMPQLQKKSTSMSLTIRSSSPKTPEVPPHRSTLVQALSQPLQRMQSPVSSLCSVDVSGPPVVTKVLQDAQASEGQVVVLECRVRGGPPLQVRWYRQGEEILDSPDFRILQKKPRSAAEQEEICTLVIAEAFPEDGGLFCCAASNSYGSVQSAAQLTISAGLEDSSSNGVPGDNSGFDDVTAFPPPPLRDLEISLLELPPKKLPQPATEPLHVKDLESWPTMSASPPASKEKHKQKSYMPNGQPARPPSPSSPPAEITPPPPPPLPLPPPLPSQISPPTPGSLSPSPGTEGPLLPTKPKPKLNASQLKQLQEQILLEQQEAAIWQQQQNQEVVPPPQEAVPADSPSPSPPLPPPPSFQELESTAGMQATTFNYARPKQFIAAQSPAGGGGGGFVTQSSGSSGSSLSSPLSPPASHKPFNKIVVPPFTESGSVDSPSSPSFPPPPPPFFASSNLSSPSGSAHDFPPPPPPPPPPPVSMSSVLPDISTPLSFVPSSPASSFLSSVLLATPPTPRGPAVNALGLPKGNSTVKVFPKKSPTARTPRLSSDSDIQGSKDAVIQDLERKLRFKEERMSNGQQEYKVSSFEQRLISEIEFRLERSPVEESDEDVQHDPDSVGQGGRVPSFDQKLKHYKVFEGMPVTFICKVAGDPKPKVYWFKDGKQISKWSEHYRISRGTDGTCTLHTAAASLDDDGNYTIMAGNPEGRVSCTGRMMVQAVNQRGRSQRSTPGHMRRPRSRSRDSGDENDIQERHFRPHFLQAPGDLIVQEGRLCRMDCKVSGLPTPDLVWQLNEQTIRPDSAHKMLVRENGVHSLVIEPVTGRDAGIYTCIASNRAGQNSFNLELIVAAKEMHKVPSFVEKLQNTSVAEGHPVRLECRVIGVPAPQIFWKRENESLTHNTDRISMHQDNCGYLCMIIQPATKEDAGWYTVSAKNEAGIVSSTARLDVYAQWQQPNLTKPKKVRPATSRYAVLTERGLDVKAAFFPDSSPLPPGSLVESDDL
ncbi:palladin isoform X3 [Dunckerocampus dactyliophorus]|uniref:palladin isoform X3 n=1 Tax=Dunckerocampus dactyliophorus TaxID=161453 RepID=UPI002405BA4C|nr:palladin isoform X3 [Dunckerocampus dactyliophorus]